MKALLYHVGYGLVWLLTLLPLRILYLISDVLFLMNYHLIGYRKKVVEGNLRKAFPEKPPEEIRAITRRFFRYFTDLMIEMAYMIHMPAAEQRQRFRVTNSKVLGDFHARGKSVFLMLSHYGNWEWGNILAEVMPHQLIGVYKPLQNQYMDRLWIRLRATYGARLWAMDHTLRGLIEYRDQNIPVAVYTLSDQRPQWGNLEHWMRFLNQDTPLISGTDRLARKFDYPVVFLDISRPERGYYNCDIRVLCEDPSKARPHEITLAYFRTLEQKIHERPELWLWSHKRWKYRREFARDPIDIDKVAES